MEYLLFVGGAGAVIAAIVYDRLPWSWTHGESWSSPAPGPLTTPEPSPGEVEQRRLAWADWARHELPVGRAVWVYGRHGYMGKRQGWVGGTVVGHTPAWGDVVVAFDQVKTTELPDGMQVPVHMHPTGCTAHPWQVVPRD